MSSNVSHVLNVNLSVDVQCGHIVFETGYGLKNELNSSFLRSTREIGNPFLLGLCRHLMKQVALFTQSLFTVIPQFKLFRPIKSR